MNKRIYITHCSAKKDDSFRGTKKKVTPDRLYLATPLQRFIKKCKDKGVDWAIFSDKYGVVFPHNKIEWYNKHPSKVKPDEFRDLVDDFVMKLSKYDEIWFYHNPGRFHQLYKKLVEKVRNRGLNVKLFTHLSEIR
ncbi:MAG: hypothetical protein J7K12_00290 [Thermoplasmata archaeon]|nr:hypothetical protein [Thermoplasmata archaeon]